MQEPDDYEDKKFIKMPPPRDPQDIADARAYLDRVSRTQEDPDHWLQEMTEALGLDEASQRALRQFRESCYPYAGTVRGYNIHLISYTTMCSLCQPVQDAERAKDRRKEGELA